MTLRQTGPLCGLSAIGDVLLATPCVRALRASFPDARIDFLSGQEGSTVLEGNPYLDEVIVHRKGAREFVRLARRLASGRYDAVLDFHSVPRTASLAAVSRAPVRIGVRGHGPRNLLYTHVLPRDETVTYVMHKKLALLEALGTPRGSESLRPVLLVGEEEDAWADAAWARLELGSAERVVAISPVSRLAFKQWGALRWARVADRLQESGARVLLTNGPAELDQVAEVVGHMETRAAAGLPDLTMKRLAALYRRCDLWIGNDGGPKHVAVAAGTPTLTVTRWGIGPIGSDPTDPNQRWFDPAPPRGCDRRCGRCPHRGCLTQTSVDQVVGEALSMMLERASERERAC